MNIRHSVMFKEAVNDINWSNEYTWFITVIKCYYTDVKNLYLGSLI